MSSLIETTVGEVRQACERAYAKYDDMVTAILSDFDMTVAQHDTLPWWNKLFSPRPLWDWHLPAWWDCLYATEKRNAVWRLQQSIRDVPNHNVMHLTVEDTRLIEIGTLS